MKTALVASLCDPNQAKPPSTIVSKLHVHAVEYWQFRASEAQPNWEGLHNHNKYLYCSCSTFLHSFAKRSYRAGQT